MAVGLGVAQVTAYALNLVGARRLGPDEFGIMASMLGVILIGNVIALGIQLVTARHLTRDTSQDGAAHSRFTLGYSWRVGVGVALLFVLLTPALVWLLHLDGPAVVLVVATSFVPLTASGAQLGVAQGHESFGRLSLLYGLLGLTKSVGGIAGAVLTATATGTMTGFALGCLAGTLLGMIVVRALAGPAGRAIEGMTPQTLHAANSLLALFALTSLDVLLARHFLPSGAAGLYAAGSLVTKVAFFLPQFVIVVAFPRMARTGGALASLLAAAGTVAVGLVVVAVTLVAAPAVVFVVGGPGYEAITPWVALFAALGSAFALAQVLLYSRLAVDDRLAVVVVWAAVGALVVAVWAGPHDTVRVVVLTALIITTVLDVVGLAVAVRTWRGERRTAPDAA